MVDRWPGVYLYAFGMLEKCIFYLIYILSELSTVHVCLDLHQKRSSADNVIKMVCLEFECETCRDTNYNAPLIYMYALSGMSVCVWGCARVHPFVFVKGISTIWMMC